MFSTAAGLKNILSRSSYPVSHFKKNATLSALIESFFQLDCYTPLYEKDTKQMQNRSKETTEKVIELKIKSLEPSS